AVLGEGRWNEAVVARKMDRICEHAVEAKDVELRIVLVLVRACARCFDDRVSDGLLAAHGGVRPDWQIPKGFVLRVHTREPAASNPSASVGRARRAVRPRGS